MSDDYPYAIPEMDPTLRKQIQECNWQVVNVTTPANYFHVLRRQVSAAIVVYLLTIFKVFVQHFNILSLPLSTDSQRVP